MKRYRYALCAVFLLAVVFRFVNYPNRWGLATDQANFALTGLHAVRSHAIPLLGPFSSGGPFQTGGIWYWLVSAGNILFPGLVIGPWLFMEVLALVFVLAMVCAGWLLGGPILGLLAGTLAALSPAQITQATNLSNQTPIALPAAGAIIAAIGYVRTKSPLYLFFIGLGIGIASAIHLQGAGLLPLAAVAILLAGVPTLRGLILLALGLMLPWASVLIADAGNDWYNTTSMIRYYTVDQYNISLDVLGRRWLTFATQFMPNIWGFTIGGYPQLGAAAILLGIGVGSWQILRRSVSREWLLLIASFAGSIVIVRYTRVPLFDSFVVFFHPFILLLTAGIVWFFLRHIRPIGIALLLVLFAGSTLRNVSEIRLATNVSAREAQRQRQTLTSQFPGKKIAVYDYRYSNTAFSLPLVLYLEHAYLTDPDGVKIGVSSSGLQNLSGSSSAQLEEAGWAYIDAKTIYTNVQHWYKKK